MTLEIVKAVRKVQPKEFAYAEPDDVIELAKWLSGWGVEATVTFKLQGPVLSVGGYVRALPSWFDTSGQPVGNESFEDFYEVVTDAADQ